MVILHDEEYYRSRIPRPDLGPLRNFLRFVWDHDRKAFLDRTAKEWGITVCTYIENYNLTYVVWNK